MRNRQVIGIFVMVLAGVTLLGSDVVAADESTTGGVAHVMGGIGIDSRNEMLAQQRHYSARIMFADAGGRFASDVGVVVRDAGRHVVLDVEKSEPWLMVALPAGNTYSVDATFRGTTRHATFTTEADATQVVLVTFPAVE